MASKSSSLQSGDDFLNPPFEGERIFRFRSIQGVERTLQDVHRTWDPRQSEYLVFVDVPPHAFDRLSSNESSLFSHCRKLYVSTTQHITIKMLSKPHEVLSFRFQELLTKKIDAIGARSKFAIEGGADRKMANITKSPDGSWRPLGNAGKYATGVLEVGYSETLTRLKRDVRLWIETKDSHVQHVVLAKISLKKPEILFQIWEASGREHIETRSRTLQAKMTGVAKVERDNNQLKTKGSIHLSYEAILEGKPPQGTPDKIILTGDELAEIAEFVWESQDFPKIGGDGGEGVGAA